MHKVRDANPSWIGSGSKDSVLPSGSKTKTIPSVTGAGALGASYPDTEESKRKIQESEIRKINSHKVK